MYRHRICKKREITIIPGNPYRRKIIATSLNDTPSISDPIPEDPGRLTVVPTINRYFYVPTTNINLQNGATLPATLFYTDDGNNVEEFIISIPNGYTNLYINAVMQEGGFYSVDENGLTISATSGIINARTPIIIESLGFSLIPAQSGVG